MRTYSWLWETRKIISQSNNCFGLESAFGGLSGKSLIGWAFFVDDVFKLFFQLKIFFLI
jgi:hypothetical protein